MRRLEHSKYDNSFILKGGLFLYCLSGFRSRPTMDIDFEMRYLSNTAENITKVIMEILSTGTENDFITFELFKTAPIIEQEDFTG